MLYFHFYFYILYSSIRLVSHFPCGLYKLCFWILIGLQFCLRSAIQ
uniref:Uncharacterized protein n=1 Tax=Rhizophora mucronata TaxID=61149 RepID=A0A2P2P8Q4_RHIMU